MCWEDPPSSSPFFNWYIHIYIVASRFVNDDVLQCLPASRHTLHGATAGFNAIIMSQSIALFAGALGVGVSSIAYYISSSERYRINKLRAHENISIHEIDVAAFEDGKSPEPNEYLIQGVIDGGEAVPLEECSKKVRNKHKPVYNKVTRVDTLFKCEILQQTQNKSHVICSEYQSFAKVTRQRSENIRVKQQGNYWSQIMHLRHIKDESIDEFGLKEIYSRFEPVGTPAETQALKMQHRALVLQTAKVKNSDGVSSYSCEPVLLGQNVKVEALCEGDNAYVFGGIYFYNKLDEHLTCQTPYLITLNTSRHQVVEKLKSKISIAESVKWYVGLPSLLLLGFGSGAAENFIRGR